MSEQKARTEALAQRWQGLPTMAQDTVIAVLAGSLAAWFPAGPLTLSGQLPEWLALIACTAPLVWRRRFPVASALATSAGVLLADALNATHTLVVLAVFAGASAAYHRPRTFPFLLVASVGWWLAYMYAVFPPEALEARPETTVYFLGTMTPSLAPATVGYILRLRRERTEQHLRTIRSRFQQERLRERARIARDVHDIAGHHLSAIRLLAAGGQQALGADSKAAYDALGSVAEVSSRAVREVRELLDQLRGDQLTDPPPPDVALSELQDLIRALDGTGLQKIDLALPFGVDYGIPARVRADAYRIVQESLSNVLRHSSARRVRIKLTRTIRELTVTVEDDGSLTQGPDGEHTGHGLKGMRERAEALGGRLRAEHLPVRGWRVQAVLPFAGATGPVAAAAPTDTESAREEDGGPAANGTKERGRA